jgi:hypothetical protein
MPPGVDGLRSDVGLQPLAEYHEEFAEACAAAG